MGNRELEPVDDPDSQVITLCEDDLADQKIYKLDEKTTLKDPTCSICLNEICHVTGEEATLVCELTCGHSFHANCVLGWLTKQSHCCPNCRKDLRVKTKK